MDNRIIFTIIGALAGMAVLYLFLWPDFEETTTVTEKETIDTSFNDVSEVIVFDSLLFQSLSDSIDHYRSLYANELRKEKITIVPEGEPISAPLRRYQGFKPTLYGNISYNALVIGSLQEISLRQDLKIPQINHKIERSSTTIRTIKPSGIYLTGGINSHFHYSLGATYLKDKSMIGYEYQPQIELHALKVGFKIF